MEQLGDIFTKPGAKQHSLNSFPLGAFSATNVLSYGKSLYPVGNDNDTSLLMADPSPPPSLTRGTFSCLFSCNSEQSLTLFDIVQYRA